jgi:hypothetical protein
MSERDLLLLKYVEVNFNKWKHLFQLEKYHDSLSYKIKGAITRQGKNFSIPLNMIYAVQTNNSTLFEINVRVLTEENKLDLLDFVTSSTVTVPCLLVTLDTDLTVFDKQRLRQASIKIMCSQVNSYDFDNWCVSNREKASFDLYM